MRRIPPRPIIFAAGPLLAVAASALAPAPAGARQAGVQKPPTSQPSSPPAATYLPRAGARDPELRATMARLLADRGVRAPVRLVIVEPEWQVERLPDRGLIARRTRNAAVLYRDPAARDRPLLLRYALFAMEFVGRGRGGRYGPVYLRELGPPRPFVGAPP